MILLFGGTSETASLAEGLAAAGYDVLVSTATDAALNTGNHPSITRRIGRLDKESALSLIQERRTQAIVDAAHPYAALLHNTANQVAAHCGIPIFRYLRPSTLNEADDILIADSHEDAAAKAFSQCRPVLLTTGSRNLLPYMRESRRTGIPLYARVLPESESLEACRSAGMIQDCVIPARGPFSLEDNRALIRKYSIGTIVTKDSGAAGGIAEKLEAARLENCAIVMVQRPDYPGAYAFSSIPALIAEINLTLAKM